jgi:phosphoglycerol transferase MdoB-like AlkP superfamily enzyme
MSRLPIRPHIRLAVEMAAVLFLAGSLARMIFMAWFLPPNSGIAWNDLSGALLLGARYDLRVAILSITLAWLLASMWWLGRFVRPPFLRRFWWGYWMIACIVWAVGSIMDAGHYSYLSKRLSATLIALARDPAEATGMMWQSYPVIWIASGFVAWLLLSHWLFSWLWMRAIKHKAENPVAGKRQWQIIATESVFFLAGLFLVHGKISQYPLRWSDSATLTSAFAQQLALNPLHNLYDTWSFHEQSIDEAAIRPNADFIRAFVGLPPLQPGKAVSFLRSVPAKPQVLSGDRPPLNVVLVLLESFAGHKVGALGNPLGATPSFDALARDGVLFTRMMSAHAHTARGVFASVTGIPDVSIHSTASRNPLAANQHTIINEFKNYAKYYFIGGSTSWANIRGLLAANIDGIEIYEEGRLKSKSEDVWGVSDKNLLLEANEILREQSKPFFAMIQTAGNHRPYTIPKEDLNVFRPGTPSQQELLAQGFSSIEEYRSFAYLDWSIGQFIERARKEKYFANTIFAFMGDHGIIGTTGPHLPKAWKELAITQGHTPLLIYAPGHVAPGRFDFWAQQVDVLPTLASLVGIGYRNTTLGRDLLDPKFNSTRMAFAFQFTGAGERGALVDNYFFLARKPPAIFDILSATPADNLLARNPLPADLQQLEERWSRFPGIYGDAALYLQTHNPKLSD